ncbi:MAG: aquaporin [Gemmataceae bacterium]
MTRRSHLPEYLMEAFGLGLFLMSAGGFATLLWAEDSPVRAAVPGDLARRALMGVAMGLTAVVNIYSPWGRRSGSHLNPATTLTFWRLGKVSGRDAAFYVAAQFVGGTLGAASAYTLLGHRFLRPPVTAVVTAPGQHGVSVAFLAELTITFALILVVLAVNNSHRFARYTGFVVGAMVAVYITIEAPLSGMSMNPARSFASAAVSGNWDHLWVYFVAPPLGMLSAAQVFVWWHGRRAVRCAKMDHDGRFRCIFCEHQAKQVSAATATPAPTPHEVHHVA